MKLLLDTHALLWWLADSERLGARARDLISDPGNEALVSAVSLWEIVVKIRAGKLAADVEEILLCVDRQGFILLAIEAAHLRTVQGLPVLHRDPFDHLLVAQAIVEGAVFMTDDEHVPRYAVETVGCSD